MKKAKNTPAGYLAFTLHSHLPYVVHHGTWPHGMEWLHEAAAETYLPLLRVLGTLERDGIPANFNISLSPILLEQLAHPFFIAEFPKYLTRKMVAAREDEAFFIQAGDRHLTETARFWGRFFSVALHDFDSLGGDIIKGFRHFEDVGMIEIMTCGATHGYMPLLGTDESVRAQVQTAVTTHKRHLGRHPRGIWIPECGYRPAGFWNYPVMASGATEPSLVSSASELSRRYRNQALSTSSSTPIWSKTADGFPPLTVRPAVAFLAILNWRRLLKGPRETSTSPITSTDNTTSGSPLLSSRAIPAQASRCGPAILAILATQTIWTFTRSVSPADIATGRSQALAST